MALSGWFTVCCGKAVEDRRVVYIEVVQLQNQKIGVEQKLCIEMY